MELFLLIGAAAVAVILLKGHRGPGLAVAGTGLGLIAALVAIAGGNDESGMPVEHAAWLAALLVWTVLSVVAAGRPPAPDSQWVRRQRPDGLRNVPVVARLRHSVLGALAGATPALALTAAVLAVADTGDESQIAFLAVPLGLIGIAVGSWLGFTWVPRSATPTPVDDREPDAQRTSAR